MNIAKYVYYRIYRFQKARGPHVWPESSSVGALSSLIILNIFTVDKLVFLVAGVSPLSWSKIDRFWTSFGCAAIAAIVVVCTYGRSERIFMQYLGETDLVRRRRGWMVLGYIIASFLMFIGSFVAYALRVKSVQ